MNLDKFIKVVIVPFFIIIAIKSFCTKDPNAPLYKGNKFKITRPVGWITSKEPGPMGVFSTNTDDIESVTFYNPAQVSGASGLPPDMISVFATDLESPMWVDDLFPEIMRAVQYDANRIIDKGDMDITKNQVAKWVLYEDKNFPIWNLEFYFVDDKKGFYKIRCSCQRETFGQCAQTCEQARNSFEFVISLF